MTFAHDCLKGRHVLVTGASSGLGRATAVRLSTLGARLHLVGRSADRLQRTLGEMTGDGHHWTATSIDDDVSADALIRTIVAKHGALDGIFHSAGSSIVVPIRLTKTEQIDEMFGAAVKGALGLVRALSRKGMMNDGGSIVFMSSVSGLRGRRGMVAYSAAKAATGGMMRALAVELADRKIRVNSIAAGAVETEMHATFVNSVSDEMVRGYESLHPLGFGKPDDVADAVAFFLSDASKWITGVDLSVDGGYAAK